MFSVTSESSISSGVRRVEAVAGQGAVQSMLEARNHLQDLQGMLNVKGSQISSKVADLIKENKALKKGTKTKKSAAIDLKETIHKINDFDLAIIQADTQNVQDLRNMVDQSKKDHTNKCVLIFSHQKSRVVMVCGVTEDMQDSLSANDVIKLIAKLHHGKGGGRNDFAQGAAESDNFEEFVNSIPDIVQSIA